ncbi:amino acid ABC transporter permease [Aquabacter spiritensis]|uniref:Amino acid ABC transporter membrane protein 1 (PAAT family) n=1 Tax=Aquabacter spiritensis TaxID=933073 RepID=A0A4R3LNL5_9HYPH|nr:amino acid ABC transporter permease [Aquabacter spiritensis]TCT01039.1 amino acid ABC transporter membrane protein 1 (PAAT family) [Aquabacter spiritensis]
MAYSLDFGALAEYAPIFAKGVAVTSELTLVGGVLGVGLGILCAWVRTDGPKALRPIVSLYVEVIRNTPFLIQLFFIFFGLPSIGVSLTEMQAAILAMVVNLGAYAAEIIRAGIEATPRGQFEAGASLAMTRLQIFRNVVLVPALQRIWPALSSQIIIVMFGSAVCSQIAVEDITFAANFIQSRNFRAFEAYIVATVLYLILALILRQIMRSLGTIIFPRRRVVR